MFSLVTSDVPVSTLTGLSVYIDLLREVGDGVVALQERLLVDRDIDQSRP